jgi:hypothetical protein
MCWSLAAATLLIIGLVRWSGLTPIEALAVSVFFTFAPPVTSALLIQANGANIEPFVYVLVLWMLRARPLWFGAILAIGVLNREFTAYAVPVILAIQLATRELFRRERLRQWLLAAAACGVVWQVVAAVKPYADIFGPGTRGAMTGRPTVPESDNLLYRMDINVRELPARARAMLVDYLPRQIGATSTDSSTAPQGRDWLFWPIAAGLAAVVVRAAWLWWRRREEVPAARLEFPLYLAGVGVLAAAGYIVTRSADAGRIDRYMLLVLYLPVGLLALFMALEDRVVIRQLVVGLLAGWAIVSGVDHSKLLERYRGGKEPDEVQLLADGLVARGIPVAEAGYWRAYRTTFLARERVKVASTDVVRIDEYTALAATQGDRLRVIQTRPCATDQAPIGEWYLCPEPKP